MIRGLQNWDRGPESIVLVRHGESVGNLADLEAKGRKAERLDLSVRDADVELSETGFAQATTLRDHVATLPAEERPTVVVSSPFVRAEATARLAIDATDLRLVIDERLRERDLGQLDGLTGAGIRHLFAEEAERRAKVGKFYYQPLGGESWADVVLRVRSFLSDLRQACDHERVWLFTHQAVIMAFRYVLEGISEADLLRIDREATIPNCSLTRYDVRSDGPTLLDFASTYMLGEDTITQEPSVATRTGRS